MWRCGVQPNMERWLSWSKAHDWKSCNVSKAFWGSNPHLSARNPEPLGPGFFVLSSHFSFLKKKCLTNAHLSGIIVWRCGVQPNMERWLSWSKAHDWKSCNVSKAFWGSNPHLSARNPKPYGFGFFVFSAFLCSALTFVRCSAMLNKTSEGGFFMASSKRKKHGAGYVVLIAVLILVPVSYTHLTLPTN